MDPVFAKLNYKEGQVMVVLNQPEMFENLLRTLPAEITVFKEVSLDQPIDFVLVFSTCRSEVEEYAQRVAPGLKGDAIFWLAYPKGTSKKYKCDFNRDTSWEIMAPYGMMPVRQVSIDDDWSALRFRKTEFIKSDKLKK
ncbi:MAG: hypothetical protein PHT07_01690 [Paludibacter sp.]|nr:hypothetical protein [Paludibacter sp.]